VIIPYSSDAPIYHYPWATLGVIGANTAIHIALLFLPPDAAEPFAMKLGDGLHPIQWLTHNFLHAGFMHLIGNMIFLWAYGIIVEGKIGWFSFLLTYLAIGTAHGAAIQAAYLHASQPSYVLGASAIIFGLMAMCMIWAPMNELSCVFLAFVGFRVISHEFEVRIYVLALIQLALEAVSVGLQFMIRGDPMSSGLLHISGTLWGLVAGVLLLKLGWVDCEGWDVFSLMKKRKGLREAWKAREARLDLSKANRRRPKVVIADGAPAGPSPEERAAKLLAKARRAIDSGDMETAGSAFEAWLAATGDRPPRETLLGLIKAMHERGELASSVPLMRAFCRAHPEMSARVRLRLATVLVRDLGRPTEARRHLLLVSPESLDVSLRRVRQTLLEEADGMIADGVLEVEEDA
jgi:membrane associated rhomboid family serine protease